RVTVGRWTHQAAEHARVIPWSIQTGAVPAQEAGTGPGTWRQKLLNRLAADPPAMRSHSLAEPDPSKSRNVPYGRKQAGVSGNASEARRILIIDFPPDGVAAIASARRNPLSQRGGWQVHRARKLEWVEHLGFDDLIERIACN